MKIDTALTVGASADPREAAKKAEEAGFDTLWATEVKHDPLLALAVAATVTEHVELGTNIAVAFARNPMSLAASAHDLQALSQGRVLLGLGAQVAAHITRRFSMPWSRPASRMREYVLALRAIWACWAEGTPLDFEGEFYTHNLMTPMFTPEPHGHGAPRVLLAGVGPAMTAAAGEVADGFLFHRFTTERYVREVTLPALEAGRGRGLEGFELVGLPLIATGRNDEELEGSIRGVRDQIAFYGSTPAYKGVLELHGWGELGVELHALSKQGEWERMSAMVDDELLHTMAVVGDPITIARDLLQRYGDIFTRCSVNMPWANDPQLMVAIADAFHAQSATPDLQAVRLQYPDQLEP